MAKEQKARWLRTAIFIAAIGVILAVWAFYFGLADPGHQVEVENRSGQTITWLEFNYPGGVLHFADIPPGQKREASFTRQTSWGTMGVVGELSDRTRVSGTIGVFVHPNMPQLQVGFSVAGDGSIKLHKPTN